MRLSVSQFRPFAGLHFGGEFGKFGRLGSSRVRQPDEHHRDRRRADRLENQQRKRFIVFPD